MAFKEPWSVRSKQRVHPKTKEAKKLNEEVPFLGISPDEERDSAGQLIIYLESNHGRKGWVVLGKYAEPRQDGNQFYVCDKRHSFYANGLTTYHEDLLMAVAKITQLKEEFE
jgi:hypothetical protein